MSESRQLIEGPLAGQQFSLPARRAESEQQWHVGSLRMAHSYY